MNDIQISSPITIYCGSTWQKTIAITPSSGPITISSVTQKLVARDSTTDLSGTYITGSPSISGTQITTGAVGVLSAVTIPPGSYTYFLLITTSSGIYVIYQQIEFVALKGL